MPLTPGYLWHWAHPPLRCNLGPGNPVLHISALPFVGPSSFSSSEGWALAALGTMVRETRLPGPLPSDKLEAGDSTSPPQCSHPATGDEHGTCLLVGGTGCSEIIWRVLWRGVWHRELWANTGSYHAGGCPCRPLSSAQTKGVGLSPGKAPGCPSFPPTTPFLPCACSHPSPV